MPVVVELELLNQAEQTLLSEALLLWIIAYRLQRPQDRDGLRHVVLIEEAHHLLRSPPGVGDGTEPVIHTALREVRELGESVILATQNASIVPLAVFGNQATTFGFHTKHASDVRAVSQAMLLQDEAKDEQGQRAGTEMARADTHPPGPPASWGWKGHGFGHPQDHGVPGVFHGFRAVPRSGREARHYSRGSAPG